MCMNYASAPRWLSILQLHWPLPLHSTRTCVLFRQPLSCCPFQQCYPIKLRQFHSCCWQFHNWWRRQAIKCCLWILHRWICCQVLQRDCCPSCVCSLCLIDQLSNTLGSRDFVIGDLAIGVFVPSFLLHIRARARSARMQQLCNTPSVSCVRPKKGLELGKRQVSWMTLMAHRR